MLIPIYPPTDVGQGTSGKGVLDGASCDAPGVGHKIVSDIRQIKNKGVKKKGEKEREKGKKSERMRKKERE